MRRVLRVLIVVSLFAAPKDFVGADQCGTCHTAELTQWKSTAHARAADVLGTHAKDGACLVCHGTGEGVSSRLRPGVQCEACHGGGAAYDPDDVMRDLPLARLLGLRADPLATCARCHRVSTGTSLHTFDATKDWARIAHTTTKTP
jgi:hypothetical protein